MQVEQMVNLAAIQFACLLSHCMTGYIHFSKEVPYD